MTTTAASTTTADALHVSDLRFSYAAGAKWYVRDLRLARGEQAVLTGGSGTGKSTLLYLIAGLIDAHAGEVFVAGTDMCKLRGHGRDLHRGRHIGMIFQTFNLLHGFSAMQNVMAAMMFNPAIPARDHRQRAASLLDQLGIQRAHAEAHTLSVGQQQRVAVARALACGPTVVLADEPTASLDPENAAGAIDLIRSACKAAGAALLCVSHDPAVAAKFERRIILNDIAEITMPREAAV